MSKLKIKKINENTNKPSSKKHEWEDKGVGNDGNGKKKGRGRKGRKGAGNKKKERNPNRKTTAKVCQCDECGKDLTKIPPLKSKNIRIIEEITELPGETEIIQVEQEKKYCNTCQKVVTARSEAALPGFDIGLNSTTLICYLWLGICVPYTKISEYLSTFFGLRLSTAGLSKHVIKVSVILKAVHEEILQDVKRSLILYADETGWRVKGKNWWLWVFGTKDAAFFIIDKSRGSEVILRVLGIVFFGVLVVDGWGAYYSIICEQQSCMAHLLRKIRAFRNAYPELVSVSRFYVMFRKILRDGERLQADREKIGEEIFRRRLKKLYERLEVLLNWRNPNDILKDIIKKVRNQEPRILTFVEHPNAPCHNNFAEFLIRLGILKRKISGGSKSAAGAEAYSLLLSIYVTCKLRKISFPSFMLETLKTYIRTGKPMLLREYASKHSSLKAA